MIGKGGQLFSSPSGVNEHWEGQATQSDVGRILHVVGVGERSAALDLTFSGTRLTSSDDREVVGGCDIP